MPFEVIESTDPLTGRVQLRTSAIFEMAISLHTLLFTDRHPEWAEAARAALSSDLLAEARAVYEPYAKGQAFYELAFDYPDQDDVPGFIRHVRRMDAVTFLFYVVGRVATPEQIEAADFDAARLDPFLRAGATEYYYEGHLALLPFDELLADVSAVQNRVADLWESYWDAFFNTQVEELRPYWEDALAEKQRILARDGGQALYDLLSEGKPFPPSIPEGQPYTEFVFIPIYTQPRPVYMLFGYGNVTLLFSTGFTEARAAEREQVKQDVLDTTKALGDGTRLKILHTIATHEGTLHGKLIAAKVGLSPSSVSRHLAQLRDAGLIVEVPLDNRVIAYRIQREAIAALPDKLLDYLDG